MPSAVSRHFLIRSVIGAAAVTTVLLSAGCATSTESAVRYDKRPTEPVELSSLRVIFVETEYKLTGERPWLTSAQVNAQRAMLSTAFRTEFPAALAAAGLSAQVKSFVEPVDFKADEVRQWIGTWPAQPHLLIVTPSGGRVFCTGGPCNFRFGAEMRLYSTNGPALLWSAKLQQPDVTPSLKIGQSQDYVHFSREMARVLLQDTTARPRP